MPEIAVRAVPIRVDAQRITEEISRAARQLGVEVYLVGGFVRDRLLGQTGKDIDLVAVGSDGVAILQEAARTFGWPRPQQFERFGTAQIRGDGFIVESVRARSERYDPLSRKPDVAPGTLEQDIWRRDFTVNTLCQTLDGRVIDITGMGLLDLTAGILRTPLDADETFSEDPLRMMRAARFASQLDFVLAAGLAESMRRQCERLRIVSIERICDELRRLLLGRSPSRGLDVLRQGGILEIVLPEIAAMIGVEQSGFHHHDVYGHTLEAVDAAPRQLLPRLAALLHDVGKPPTHAIAEDGRHTFYNHPAVGSRMAAEMLQRLRFSNHEIEAVSRIVLMHLRPIMYRDETFSDAAVRRLIRDAGELRDTLLEVARADTAASDYPDTDNIEALAARMAALDRAGEVSALKVPLKGEEIIALAPGRGPGPWVGAVKRALEEAILDGDIPPGDSQACRHWLQAHPHLLAP